MQKAVNLVTLNRIRMKKCKQLFYFKLATVVLLNLVKQRERNFLKGNYENIIYSNYF